MITKDITYTNLFTGDEVTETHHFHISAAKMAEWEIEEHKEVYVKDGEELTGPRARLQRIIDEENGKEIISGIKEFIRRSYGRRQGNDFLQSDEIANRFMASEACGQLLLELCTDADKAAEFMNGVTPKNLDEIAEKMRQQQIDRERQSPATAQVADIVEGRATESTPSQPSEADIALKERGAKLRAATSENPVILDRADVISLTDEEYRSGLAEGRFKLS